MSTKNETITQELPKSIVPKSIEESPKSTIEESPKSTKEKWNKDNDVQTWLKDRLKRPCEATYEDRIQQVKIWKRTVEHDTWLFNKDIVLGQGRGIPEAPEKAIQYIRRYAPKDTWDWRLNEVIPVPEDEVIPEAGGDLYVNWWCYMRKFINDHPELVKETEKLPTAGYVEIENQILEKSIYPTLNKWLIIFPTLDFSVEKLSIEAVSDHILAKFAEWLLKLAADRQMFGSEKTYRSGIPRIVISGGIKKLILDVTTLKEIQDQNIQDRDASVTYIMQEGSKILSERGFDMEVKVWGKINKKYTWLLSGK